MWCILCGCWYYITHQEGRISPGCLPEPCTEEIKQIRSKQVCTKKHNHPKPLVISESTGLAVNSTKGDMISVYHLFQIKLIQKIERLAKYNILDVILEAASTGDLQKDLHSILTSCIVDICWKRLCQLIFKYKKEITITQHKRIILSNVDISNYILPTLFQLRSITLL